MLEAFRLENLGFFTADKLNYFSVCSNFSDAGKTAFFVFFFESNFFFRICCKKQFKIFPAVQSVI